MAEDRPEKPVSGWKPLFSPPTPTNIRTGEPKPEVVSGWKPLGEGISEQPSVDQKPPVLATNLETGEKTPGVVTGWSGKLDNLPPDSSK